MIQSDTPAQPIRITADDVQAGGRRSVDPPGTARGARRLRAWAVPLLGLVLAACEAPKPAPAANAAADNAPCRVTRVTDGDTVELACAELGRFDARLTGFDTPELFSPRCAAEKRVAATAKARLGAMVRSASVVDARIGAFDRYGRRLVRLRLDGTDVGRVLISEGLAVPYSGGRRIDWCARLA